MGLKLVLIKENQFVWWIVGIESWLNCLEKLSFLVVERHCLQVQNTQKHISATIEFQNFPGDRTGLADSLPRCQTHLPSCSNLNETPLTLRSVHLTDTNFFPLVFWRGSYCTYFYNHKLMSFFSFSLRHGSLNSLFCVTKHKILVKDLNTTKMRRRLNFINQLNIASI